jgi:ferredoxin
MDNDFYNNTRIHGSLEPFGLLLIGVLHVTDEDRVPDIADGLPARQLLLIGNGGSSFWPEFRRSEEFADGLADPLDRWSRRVGNQVAQALGGWVIFPFDGPPHPPFLAWAGKTGQAVASRLSLFIHERYGLWHAYRFALALPERVDLSPVESGFESPCLSCADKPCLQVCPVNAFSGPSYRADLCMDYLRADSTSACRQLGCEARRACPVGKAFTYVPEQARFHMDAFVSSPQMR